MQQADFHEASDRCQLKVYPMTGAFNGESAAFTDVPSSHRLSLPGICMLATRALIAVHPGAEAAVRVKVVVAPVMQPSAVSGV
jgi:hypothetical protein